MRHIALLTDFGWKDIYVGVMKGVISNIAPKAKIIDLSHDIPPQNVRNAAFLLDNAYSYFPEETLFLNVVDPEVGSSRKIILINTEDYSFIAPDNGLLSYIIENNKINSAFNINNHKFFLNKVSSTFHGRDIFAPIAANLASGIPADELGEKIAISDIKTFSTKGFQENNNGSIISEVIHIDRFGNLVFPIKINDLLNIKHSPMFEINNIEINGLQDNFSFVRTGEYLAYRGSSGYLEIAIRNGSAAKALNISFGKEILIK